MEELLKPIRRVQRRLTLQRFVVGLGWFWFVTLTAALAIIVVDKFRPLGISTAMYLFGALGIGLFAATAWACLTRQKKLEAALEIDRRFGLKERVSSAWALPKEARETEAGQAVAADAVRRIARLHVLEKFPLRLSRRLLLPLAPALAALAAAWLIAPAGAKNPSETTEQPASPPSIKKAADNVQKQLAKSRKQAQKEHLPNAEKLLQKLEEGTRDLTAKPADKEKMLTKLNDLSQELRKRREELGGAEKLKEQLAALKDAHRGPAEPFVKALSKGNVQEAIKELQNLQKALENDKLPHQQKEAMARQMQQMQKKLEQLVQAHQAAQENLQKQIQQFRQVGQKAEAEKLERQLRRLQQQCRRMGQLQKLASQCGKCAQCLEQGNGRKAAEALNSTYAVLDDAQKQLDEAMLLDDAMSQIAQARDQMNCPQCDGSGCTACQGGGVGGLKAGRGRGGHRQMGPKIEASFYDSRARQVIGKGPATWEGMADGPNLKGNIISEIQVQDHSVRTGATDPLSGRQIPRKHGRYAEEYFNKLREGK